MKKNIEISGVLSETCKFLGICLLSCPPTTLAIVHYGVAMTFQSVSVSFVTSSVCFFCILAASFSDLVRLLLYLNSLCKWLSLFGELGRFGREGGVREGDTEHLSVL